MVAQITTLLPRDVLSCQKYSQIWSFVFCDLLRLQVKKLRPMDHLDLLNDSVGCQVTASHRQQLHKEVAATLPAYFARAMSPAVARPGWPME